MSNPKKPNLVGTGVQKGLLKTPVYDTEFFEQEAKRLGVSRAFWEGFKDGYVKTFVFGMSFGLGFAVGIFVGEMM